MEITIKHVLTISPEAEIFFRTLLRPQGGGGLPTATIAALVEETTEVAKASPAVTPKTESEGTKVADVKRPEPPATSDITLEQVRATTVAKSKTKKAEVKALMTEFGTANLTGLDKAKYTDFLTRINAL